MQSWSLVTVMISAVACVAQTLSSVPFSETQDVVRAFSPQGNVNVTVNRFLVDVNLPNGKKQRGDLVVAYSPQTGVPLWRYHHSDRDSYLRVLKEGTGAIYLLPNQTVDFMVNAQLNVTTYKGQVFSQNAAKQAALDEMQRNIGQIQDAGYVKKSEAVEVKFVPIFSSVQREFWCPPFDSPELSNATCPGTIRIVDIAQQSGNWRLVLRGRWDQEFILDSNFELVSTRQLGSLNK